MKKEPPPEIPDPGPPRGFKVELNLTIFVKAHHLSPQRIEDNLIGLVPQIVDAGDEEAFGLVSNVSVLDVEKDT